VSYFHFLFILPLQFIPKLSTKVELKTQVNF
jgi:hypothetical protein